MSSSSQLMTLIFFRGIGFNHQPVSISVHVHYHVPFLLVCIYIHHYLFHYITYHRYYTYYPTLYHLCIIYIYISMLLIHSMYTVHLFHYHISQIHIIPLKVPQTYHHYYPSSISCGLGEHLAPGLGAGARRSACGGVARTCPRTSRVQGATGVPWLFPLEIPKQWRFLPGKSWKTWNFKGKSWENHRTSMNIYIL